MLARLLLAAGLSLSWAGGAHAQVYGPDGAPTVVQRKLYRMSALWEIGLSFDTALNTALVSQNGLLLDVSYHTNEWLDLGGELLGNLTGLSALAGNVRADLCRSPPDCRSATPRRDELKGADQLRYGAFAVGRIAPIYGKLNLASELPVHFQAFLLAGAGGAAVHRESVNLCAQPGAAACTSYQSADEFKPVGEAGLGVRFYLGLRWSLQAEARAYLFGSSYRANNDLTDPSSGESRGYLAFIAAFDGGLAYLF